MLAALKVPTIFTAVDNFSGTLGKMGNNLNTFHTKAQIHFARLARSADRVSRTSKNIARNSLIGGLAIAAPLIYAAKEAINFEHQMAKVNTLVGGNTAQLALMGKQVLGITRKMPVELDDVASGLYVINSAGIMGAKGIDMVTQSSKLAVAGLGSVKTAAHLMSSVYTVFGSEGYTAAQQFNKLALTVRQGKTTIDQMGEGFGKTAISVQLAGVKLNEFLSMTAALTVKGSTAAESYTQIQGAVQAMLKPSMSMIKAFHNMGYKGSNAGQNIIKHFGGLVPAMDAVNKSLDKVGIRRAKAWGRIGAFIAQAALTPGGKGYGHYIENMDVMQNDPNAGEKMFQTMTGTTDSQFKMLKNNLRAFAIEVGLHLLPTLKKLSERITPVIDGIITWTEKNPRLFDSIIKGTAYLAGFMLVVSPIAGTVGLIADGVKLWAIWNGRLAASALASTGPIASEALAIDGVAGSFGTAKLAASSFFATLAAFTIPTALVTLAGYSFFEKSKLDAHNALQKQIDSAPADSDMGIAYNKWAVSQPGGSTGTAEEFMKYWKNLQDNIANPITPQNNFGLDNKKPIQSDMHVISPFGRAPLNGGNTTVTVVLKDPGKLVDSVTTSKPSASAAGITPDVKISSTLNVR